MNKEIKALIAEIEGLIFDKVNMSKIEKMRPDKQAQMMSYLDSAKRNLENIWHYQNESGRGAR